ncbi:hypothetical protein SUGI_0349010 [Cryptomeria japonica]|nr:hypothetical protein SUGI_0349010 [Cryptomeria japonica]
MAEENQRELRVVMFPWLAHGHIAPFVQLAKSLATHGLKIFFVSTPLNIRRIRPQMLDAPGIDLVELAMPSVEGLPAGRVRSNPAGACRYCNGFGGEQCVVPLGSACRKPIAARFPRSDRSVFFTHCGWNSMTEGLRFGVPLITLPMQFEQGLNAKLAEELKVGVEVRRNEEDGSFTKEDISKAIRVVMIEGAQIKYNVTNISDMLTSNNFQVSERNMRNFVSMLRTFNK